ncbi:MAG: hypothetical protein QGG09_20555, partial [Pirellulaceae bacterium]|nr:hypothetical protein [Pirellulaceae bacterium]
SSLTSSSTGIFWEAGKTLVERALVPVVRILPTANRADSADCAGGRWVGMLEVSVVWYLGWLQPQDHFVGPTKIAPLHLSREESPHE